MGLPVWIKALVVVHGGSLALTIIGKRDTVGLTRTEWRKRRIGQVGQEDWDMV